MSPAASPVEMNPGLLPAPLARSHPCQGFSGTAGNLYCSTGVQRRHATCLGPIRVLPCWKDTGSRKLAFSPSEVTEKEAVILRMLGKLR